MSDHSSEHPDVSSSIYFRVWAALVALTVVTVSVSYLDMKKFTIFTAMLIATVKAGLVILYFMHVRYEKLIYTVMILVVLIIYAIFILLTFLDYSFR
jgi:cytochrome c oxidase subunit 4